MEGGSRRPCPSQDIAATSLAKPEPRDAGDVLEGLRTPRDPPGAASFWVSRSRSKPSGNSEVKNKPAEWFSSNIALLKTYRFFFYRGG